MSFRAHCAISTWKHVTFDITCSNKWLIISIIATVPQKYKYLHCHSWNTRFPYFLMLFLDKYNAGFLSKRRRRELFVSSGILTSFRRICSASEVNLITLLLHSNYHYQAMKLITLLRNLTHLRQAIDKTVISFFPPC